MLKLIFFPFYMGYYALIFIAKLIEVIGELLSFIFVPIIGMICNKRKELDVEENDDDLTVKLKSLKKLHKKGLITDYDYSIKKQELLEKMK